MLAQIIGSPDPLTPQNRVKPETSTSTSRQPRKLKFGMNAYFNPTRRNMNRNNLVTWPPRPRIGLSLKLAVLCNQGSIQLSHSLAKADPIIAWARVSHITAQNLNNLKPKMDRRGIASTYIRYLRIMFGHHLLTDIFQNWLIMQETWNTIFNIILKFVPTKCFVHHFR